MSPQPVGAADENAMVADRAADTTADLSAGSFEDLATLLGC